jgi:predicted dehydrogenase
MNGLGVVVVGTGFGCRVHVPAARAAGFDVVGLVARDRARVEQRAAECGVEGAFTSLADALGRPGADIVIISTPPSTHAALTEEAIASGRHVLVEKPFAMSKDEAQRLVGIAEKAGVVALVGHEFRFQPERVTMRRAILDGRVGAPTTLDFIGTSSFLASADAQMPAWWWDEASGGGWLGASVSHIVDAIQSWLGEIETVSAALPLVSGRDPATHAEDTVVARFRLRSGCEGILHQSAATWGPRVEVVRVAGPLGTLSFAQGDVTFADGAGVETLPPAGPPLPADASGDPGGRPPMELPMAVVQAGILRDLVTGTDPVYDAAPPATFVDGTACIAVLDAMRRSARDGGALTEV